MPAFCLCVWKLIWHGVSIGKDFHWTLPGPLSWYCPKWHLPVWTSIPLFIIHPKSYRLKQRPITFQINSDILLKSQMVSWGDVSLIFDWSPDISWPQSDQAGQNMTLAWWQNIYYRELIVCTRLVVWVQCCEYGYMCSIFLVVSMSIFVLLSLMVFALALMLNLHKMWVRIHSHYCQCGQVCQIVSTSMHLLHVCEYSWEYRSILTCISTSKCDQVWVQVCTHYKCVSIIGSINPFLHAWVQASVHNGEYKYILTSSV